MSKDNGTKTAAPTLLGLLESATAADLADIDQQIAAIEEERDALIEGYDKRLVSLRACRKVIDLKVNGKPERKTRQPKAKPVPSPAATRAALDGGLGRNDSATDRGFIQRQRRMAIAKFLATAGVTGSAVIANQLEIPLGSITSVLACDWFRSEANGYRLTEAGRKEAGV